MLRYNKVHLSHPSSYYRRDTCLVEGFKLVDALIDQLKGTLGGNHPDFLKVTKEIEENFYASPHLLVRYSPYGVVTPPPPVVTSSVEPRAHTHFDLKGGPFAESNFALL